MAGQEGWGREVVAMAKGMVAIERKMAREIGGAWQIREQS
jgi:hypothetical protein